MGMIFFFILFNYTCLRNIKDSLVVTNTGAEALSFLKLFCVTPSAIVFMLLYTKASSILSNEKLFYATLSPFIIFFGLFAFAIYPYREYLHPATETIASLQAKVPSLYWPLALCGVWSYAVFYVLAELWGSALLSLSFWQFANQVTRTDEAKRVYAFFGIMAQFSLLLSGACGEYFSNIKDKVPPGVDPWQVSLNWLMGIVVVFGISTMIIYRWIYTNVLTDKRFYDKPELPGVRRGKKKAGLLESLKTIFTSPYLGLIAMLVIAYGISVNVIEGLWKSQVKLRYHNENDYNTFMSQYTIWTGVASICMLILGGNILRLCRWIVAAMFTPVVFFVGGSLFFTFILCRSQLIEVLANIGTSPIAMAVFMGATIVAMAKATKYALFDLTKEMAYIPLDEEMKVKGKAVVEVVGGRMGKSGGALIQVLLLSIVGSFVGHKVTYDQIAKYVFVALITICVLWILSVNALSKKVEEANLKMDKQK
jgi:AAA family ATP:ADP antiporter